MTNIGSRFSILACTLFVWSGSVQAALSLECKPLDVRKSGAPYTVLLRENEGSGTFSLAQKGLARPFEEKDTRPVAADADSAEFWTDAGVFPTAYRFTGLRSCVSNGTSSTEVYLYDRRNQESEPFDMLTCVCASH